MRVAAIAALAGSFALVGCVTSNDRRTPTAAAPAPIDQALAQLVAPVPAPAVPVVSSSAWEGGGSAKTPASTKIPAATEAAPDPKVSAVVEAVAPSARVAEAAPVVDRIEPPVRTPSAAEAVVPRPVVVAPQIQSVPPAMAAAPQDPASVLAQAIAANTVQPAAPLADPSLVVPAAMPAAVQDPSQLASVRAGALPPPPVAERRIVTITGENAVAAASPPRRAKPRIERSAPIPSETRRAAPPVEDKLVNTRKVF